MIVDDIMSKSLLSVKCGDNLWAVKDIFDRTGVHHVLVIENDLLTGVVSDRDYLKAISPKIDTVTETHKDAETLNKKVEHIMTKDVISIKPGADVYDAIHIFNSNKISCIPVVDDENKPVGVVSWRDILLVVAKTRKKPN